MRMKEDIFVLLNFKLLFFHVFIQITGLTKMLSLSSLSCDTRHGLSIEDHTFFSHWGSLHPPCMLCYQIVYIIVCPRHDD
jgi:hypothetical protein